jgi:hypothetical protein
VDVPLGRHDTPPLKSNPYINVALAATYWIVAVTRGEAYRYGLASAMPVIFVGAPIRARLKRQSDGGPPRA